VQMFRDIRCYSSDLILFCFSRVARGSAQSQCLSGTRDYPHNQHKSEEWILHFDDELGSVYNGSLDDVAEVGDGSLIGKGSVEGNNKTRILT
jgi:hypothetical protein